MMYYLDKLDEQTKLIIATCFPNYTGRKVKVSSGRPLQINSYWDSGSRDYFVFFDLATSKTFTMPQNHPFYNQNTEVCIYRTRV